MATPEADSPHNDKRRLVGIDEDGTAVLERPVAEADEVLAGLQRGADHILPRG